MPLNFEETKDIQSRRQGRDTNNTAETISPADWKDYDVVVEHHADDEDAEAEQLESVEVLPAHTDAGKGKVVKSFEILEVSPDHPDHQGPDAIEHHPGGCRQLLGNADPSKVEEGDGDDGAGEGKGEQGVVGELVAAVIGVLKHMPWAVTKLRSDLHIYAI